jgi:hypothetical protein
LPLCIGVVVGVVFFIELVRDDDGAVSDRRCAYALRGTGTGCGWLDTDTLIDADKNKGDS